MPENEGLKRQIAEIRESFLRNREPTLAIYGLLKGVELEVEEAIYAWQFGQSQIATGCLAKAIGYVNEADRRIRELANEQQGIDGAH